MTIATVLLVDDEIPFLETMEKRLIKRGLSVFAATSGEAALEKLREHEDIEVVILDVKMPGLDGIQTLSKIKAEHPLIEVIMLTGHATVESGIEGMKRGAFDYLMKPCDMEMLLEKVEQAATRKQMHDEKIVEARLKAITARRA